VSRVLSFEEALKNISDEQEAAEMAETFNAGSQETRKEVNSWFPA
jgi:hypothetical protein